MVQGLFNPFNEFVHALGESFQLVYALHETLEHLIFLREKKLLVIVIREFPMIVFSHYEMPQHDQFISGKMHHFYFHVLEYSACFIRSDALLFLIFMFQFHFRLPNGFMALVVHLFLFLQQLKL